MSKCCSSIFKAIGNFFSYIGRGIKCFFKAVFCCWCCCCAKKDDSDLISPKSATYSPEYSVSPSVFKVDKSTQVNIVRVNERPWPGYTKPTQIDGLEDVSPSSGNDSAAQPEESDCPYVFTSPDEDTDAKNKR